MQQQHAHIPAHIPFNVRLQLSQLDVHLDKSWHSTLVNIFKENNAQVNHLIYEQILKPKGIIFDSKNQVFINNVPRVSLQGLLSQLTSPQARLLTQQLIQGLERIQQETDLVIVGTYLESILEEIDRIDTEDKPHINQEKKLIKKHFLYDIDLIISNNRYQVPENSRNLTEHQLKSFISDVYIKNKISDYASNSIRSQALKLENSPIMDYIIEERKVRLFEVFEGNEYYYLITPSSSDEDPYSIRRFLYEEPSRFKEFYYLNGIVIDKRIIHENRTEQNRTEQNRTEQNRTEHFNKIKAQIQCFVSINKSISPQVITFLEKLDFIFQTKILPLLEISLDSKVKYSKSIASRLFELEQAICIYLLQEIMKAIDTIASSEDDLEYLYIHSILIFSNLILAYEVFQSQPALLFNHQAKEFQYRLIAWIKIVQKRRAFIFQKLDEDDFEENHKSAMKMIDDTRDILNDAMKKVRDINKHIKTKEQELKSAESANFFKRLFVKKEHIEQALEQLHEDIAETKQVAFIDIIRQAKKYTKNTIYLEYENVIGMSDTYRHYAVNMGDNGFTRLPILIKLPEDKSFFDVGETYQSLIGAFALLNQKWTIEQFELIKAQDFK